jgi:F-type H+-transporting ATPase subunit epsilon
MDEITSGGSARLMKVSVISPAQAAFEGEAMAVMAPAHDGQVGILYGHAPMVTLLGTGQLVVRSPDGEHRFDLSRGFLQVVDNEISVLAEAVQVL